MDYVWEDLGQVHVYAVVKFPLDLAEKIAKDGELVDVEQ